MTRRTYFSRVPALSRRTHADRAAASHPVGFAAGKCDATRAPGRNSGRLLEGSEALIRQPSTAKSRAMSPRSLPDRRRPPMLDRSQAGAVVATARHDAAHDDQERDRNKAWGGSVLALPSPLYERRLTSGRRAMTGADPSAPGAGAFPAPSGLGGGASPAVTPAGGRLLGQPYGHSSVFSRICASRHARGRGCDYVPRHLSC